MIRQMTGVEIVGPLPLFRQALRSIQETGLLQLEEVPLMGDASSPGLHRIHLSEGEEEERAALEELCRTLEDAVSHLPGKVAEPILSSTELPDEYRKWEKEPFSTLAARARVLHATVRSLRRRERNLSDDLRLLAAYEEVAAVLAPLVETNELSGEYEFMGVVFEQKHTLATSLFRRELEKLTKNDYRFFQGPLPSGGSAVLLGIPKSSSREVRAFVAEAGISEMTFPRYLRDKRFEEALATLEQDLQAMRRRREELGGRAGLFFAQNGLTLLAMHQLCTDLLARFHVLDFFARTEYVFVARGWLPRVELDRFTSSLRHGLGDTVVVRRVSSKSLGSPPVMLDNLRPARSFEPLLSLQPLPRYGSIDPTGFVATFFPPMFGLMLADLGYGGLVALLSGVLYLLGRKKRGLLSKLAVVAALCAFFTIAFGAVFGELFGDFGRHIGLRPLWRERFTLEGAGVQEALMGYLAMAVGMGVLHVLLGLVLGVLNARRFRDRHAVMHNLSRIAGIFLLFFVVGRLVDLLPPVFTSIAVALLVVFVVLMILQAVHDPAHGLLLPLEVMGAVGNILSYARIMAIGVVSAVLALLANMFAGMVANFVVAAIIVFLVHALNLALGIMDPTIQGMRLQYVEFFSKFFLGGGRKFTPFRKIGGSLV